MNILILIMGLIAGGTAIALVARGLTSSRLRTTQTVGQIEDYGYATPAAAKAGRLAAR